MTQIVVIWRKKKKKRKQKPTQTTAPRTKISPPLSPLPRLQDLLLDHLAQPPERDGLAQQREEGHVDLEGLVEPGAELGREHAVHAELDQRPRAVDLVDGHEDEVGEALGDEEDDGVEDGRVAVAVEGGGQLRGQARVTLEGGVRVAVEGGGEQGGAWVVERRVVAVEALRAHLLDAVGLEAGEDVRGRVRVRAGHGARGARAGDGAVDDLEQLVLGDGLNALAQEQGFDLGVLVQVTDLGDHAETDRGGREGLCAAVAGEDVEEVVGGAVVGLGGGADGAGDGGCHEEEVEVGIFAFDGVV